MQEREQNLLVLQKHTEHVFPGHAIRSISDICQ